jgi:hypothetical protein
MGAGPRGEAARHPLPPRPLRHPSYRGRKSRPFPQISGKSPSPPHPLPQDLATAIPSGHRHPIPWARGRVWRAGHLTVGERRSPICSDCGLPRLQPQMGCMWLVDCTSPSARVESRILPQSLCVTGALRRTRQPSASGPGPNVRVSAVIGPRISSWWTLPARGRRGPAGSGLVGHGPWPWLSREGSPRGQSIRAGHVPIRSTGVMDRPHAVTPEMIVISLGISPSPWIVALRIAPRPRARWRLKSNLASSAVTNEWPIGHISLHLRELFDRRPLCPA